MSDAVLNQDQTLALKALKGPENIFLTGAAGSGKSFLLREYLKNKSTPIVASTGSAAILVGGRTFHSFFGLGIMEGGFQATVERAAKNKRLLKRMETTDEVVIDEVSMLSGPMLRAAEAIARQVRGTTRPWGGIRVVAVGDFAQLPPVNPHTKQKEWGFLDPVWHASTFSPVVLNECMRTKDGKFLEVLNWIRDGVVNDSVSDFLNSKMLKEDLTPTEFTGTRLFARRENVENYNLAKLEKIKSPLQSFETEYTGKAEQIESFKKNAPIPESISLKKGALVMLRQNDLDGKWVNGSLGTIQEMDEDLLTIELLSGRTINVEKMEFTLLDADGKAVVSAYNFPVSLAWAITIHKSQGTTVDRLCVDLRRLWEPGQAYVALSRARSSSGIAVEGWDRPSIFTDAVVKLFHESIAKSA